MRECQSWVKVLPWVLTDPDITEVVHGSCPQQASMNPHYMKLKVSSHHHFLQFSLILWDNFSVCVTGIHDKRPDHFLATFSETLAFTFPCKRTPDKNTPFFLMTTFLLHPSLHISMQMNTWLMPLLLDFKCGLKKGLQLHSVKPFGA